MQRLKTSLSSEIVVSIQSGVLFCKSLYPIDSWVNLVLHLCDNKEETKLYEFV